MDGLGGFLSGVLVGALIVAISIAWNMAASGRIIIKPIKDEHKNEILYYVDIYTNKEYKMENDILYYYEED
jgi:hypothetical protein